MSKSYEEKQADLKAAIAQNDTAKIETTIKNEEAYITSDVISAAVESGNCDSVFDAFIKAGWNPNTSLGHEGTPLIAVVEFPEAVQSLLARGADPNFGQIGSSKPLDVAVLHTTPEIVNILIEGGAQVKNRNALKTASYFGRLDMIELLLGAGAEVNEIPDYPDMLEGERRMGLGTALHDAARNGQLEAAQLLLEKGARKDIRDSLGKTPAQVAEEKENFEVAALLKV